MSEPLIGKCRFCKAALKHSFCDLGVSPFSNSYLSKDLLEKEELKCPLHAYVCECCFLVQLQEFQSPEAIFGEYAYFSSYSKSWLAHAKKYVDQMMKTCGLGRSSTVIEIASNDGYLLQYFKEQNVPVLGIEPAANVAEVAKKAGIPTLVRFFGVKLAQELVESGVRADLLLGNNVLAHVPDLNDFVQGMKVLLKPQGVITMEFPHLLQLMQHHQFDTIYHEHFSYFSFLTVEKVFKAHGLTLFDVEELSTHGGSLRIYAAHQEDVSKVLSSRVVELKKREEKLGFHQLETYLQFMPKVEKTKRLLLEFLKQAKKEGKRIACYGAPAKGNTLLNYCGIGKEFLDYTVDLNPHKQGRFLPGTLLPIFHPEMIEKTRPDYLLILPWNLKEEIIQQMRVVRTWGGKFVLPIPEVEVIA
jgi:2-polyprenyl-3-methyl-5-hydroxy-6-metoxy-1,4-benzoquinol methylase